jgi:hypothetical protein
MKAMLLLLIFASSSLANEFTREAPNGSVYDTRTFYYDENKQKVLVRPELANLTDSERQDRFGMTNERNNPKWIAAKQEWKEELARRRAIRTANAQQKARQPTIIYRYYPVYRGLRVYNNCSGYHSHSWCCGDNRTSRNYYNYSSGWRR